MTSIKTTREECLANASEAERLARIVAYAPDRQRLLTQSARWRALADEIAAPPSDKPQAVSD